jgi:hypothetical protein
MWCDRIKKSLFWSWFNLQGRNRPHKCHKF